LKEVYASYFGNPTAYFVAKAGVCTKPSVKILATISINFVPFLAILFVTFEYYRNLEPDCQVKKTLIHISITTQVCSLEISF
jgi:hypothetical protein